MQVDGEPWIQPAGEVIVLRSALKVGESPARTRAALCCFLMIVNVIDKPEVTNYEALTELI